MDVEANVGAAPAGGRIFRLSILGTPHDTFSATELDPADGGGQADVEPSKEALAERSKELVGRLSTMFEAEHFEFWAEFDDLLGWG